MGGRGASSGAGGVSPRAKFKEDGQITIGMDTVEFDGTLNYYGNETAISREQRDGVSTFEGKRKKAKVEYAYAVDADGNPIGQEVRGGKTSVSAPIKFHDTQGAVFTHNHPREDGVFGGTFSTADLRNFAIFGNKTERAVAKEGTYSITKKKNFDSSGFQSFINKQHSEARQAYADALSVISKDRTSGKINYDEYRVRAKRAMNNYLIDLHNRYKSGEKTYGYSYTLERN